MCSREQLSEIQLSRKLSELNQAASLIAIEKLRVQENLKDIRQMIHSEFEHLIELLKDRRGELLNEAEKIAREKEAILIEQQLEIHESIGACNQILDSIQTKDALNFSIQDILESLSPKAHNDIGFEFNTSFIEREINSLGKITWEKENFSNPTDSHSSHISVFNPEIEEFTKDFENFEIVRINPISNEDIDRLNEISLEMPEKPARKMAAFEPEGALLSEQFKKLMNQPLSDWLLNSTPKTEMSAIQKPLKRKHSDFDNEQGAKRYEFSDVIRKISNEPNKRWVINGGNANVFDEAKFISQLTKMFAAQHLPSTSQCANSTQLF